MIQNQPSGQSQTRLLVILLTALALLTSFYFSLRFGSWEMDVDASRMTVSADAINKTGQLLNPKSYNNGYSYPALVAFLSQVSGATVQEVQLSAGLWTFVIALAAFITYRELLGNASVAALGVLLLLVQPDFMFYIVRSSHEKFTWVFALLMLFLLVRSYTYSKSPRKLAVTIGVFYLTFWAMAASNIFFAANFAVTLAIGFVGGWVLERLGRHKREAVKKRAGALQRLIFITLACLTIVWIFINYTYSPAMSIYYYLTSLYDRISMLLLGAQPVEVPTSYSYLETAWRSSGTYLALTGLQWMIVLTSLAAWGMDLFRLSRLDQKRWLLWLMYSAFGVLLAYGVVTDFLGFLSSNMQMRMFTPFTLFGSALAAGLIHQGFQALRLKWRRLVTILLTLAAAYASVAAALKVTNDPSLGNQWLFYSPAEWRAAGWMKTHMSQKQTIWVDTSEHLATSLDFWNGYDPSGMRQYIWGKLEEPVPYTLISELTRLRANRSGNSLPSTSDQNRIYDNGVAQFYHLRARTPFQH